MNHTALTHTEWPMAQLHEHILAFRKLRGSDWLKDTLAGMEPKFPDATAYNPTFWILTLGSLNEVQCVEQKRANRTSFRRGGPEKRRLIPDYWPSGSKPGAERQGARARQDNSHQEACGQGSSRGCVWLSGILS